MTTILPQKVKNELQTKVVGRTVHFFRQLTSTNEIAKALALRGAKEGTVIVAETQTQGRGRVGREWASPSGGLWFSIIMRPKVSPKNAPQLTLTVSVAVAKIIEKLFNLETKIKWPNDVLIKDKKVCGILTETSTTGKALNFAIVGVGINANFNRQDLPANLRSSSTTLKEEMNGEIDCQALLRSLLEETEHHYNLFTQGRFHAILAEWKRLSKFLGSYVEVISFGEKVEGWATDIDEDGALIIKLRDNTTRKIISGDVTILKHRRETPD